MLERRRRRKRGGCNKQPLWLRLKTIHDAPEKKKKLRCAGVPAWNAAAAGPKMAAGVEEPLRIVLGRGAGPEAERHPGHGNLVKDYRKDGFGFTSSFRSFY